MHKCVCVCLCQFMLVYLTLCVKTCQFILYIYASKSMFITYFKIIKIIANRVAINK